MAGFGCLQSAVEFRQTLFTVCILRRGAGGPWGGLRPRARFAGAAFGWPLARTTSARTHLRAAAVTAHISSPPLRQRRRSLSPHGLPRLGSGATAQRALEPAWHRRQRRRRASARVLLRLADAARTLGTHHSAQRPPRAAQQAMPADGQSRGPTEAQFEALVDRLAALERRQSAGGARSDPPTSNPGGQRAQRGERAAQRHATADGRVGRVRGRPGDWQCPHCQAYPCFARAETCYRCGSRRLDHDDGSFNKRGGADRGLAAPTDRERYFGPVGAGGARPLLGGRGAARGRAEGQRRKSPAPSYRVPGASQAARAEAEVRRNDNDVGGGRNPNGADGDFRVVQRGAPAQAPASAGATNGGRTFASSNSWAALTEEEDAMDQEEDVGAGGTDGDGDDSQSPPEAEGGHGGMDGPQGNGGDGRAGGHGQVEGGSDEHSLRLQWDEHVRACRRLERDPNMPASIVEKAKALRDEAEQRWRSARTPHSLSKRMRWAGADLRTAEEKEQAQRRELQLHLDESARRTKELESRVQVAAARTARKRAAIQELLAEGAPVDVHQQDRWPTELAATAVSGITQSIAPPLAAAIERLSSPMQCDDAEGVRQELQLAAASLCTLEQLLRGQVLPTVPLGAAAPHFDISGGDSSAGANDEGDDAHDGGGGKRRALATGASGAAAAARWTKATGSAPWTRAASSATAVEEARRTLGARIGGAAAPQCTSDRRSQTAAASSTTYNNPAGDLAAATAMAMDPARTNDLAVAERRAREASELQMRQALQQQQLQQSLEQQQLEEQQRIQRQQRQQEEQQRHMQAVEQAAATRAAEEARQREEAFAKLSPEERERARALHAQHETVGAQVFGTQAASHLAGLVHREHVQAVIRGAAEGNAEENVDFLMSLSPEEFAEYEHQQMGRGGAQ